MHMKRFLTLALSWSDAQVVQHGTYVAMIATAEHQDEITEQFNAQFA